MDSILTRHNCSQNVEAELDKLKKKNVFEKNPHFLAYQVYILDFCKQSRLR